MRYRVVILPAISACMLWSSCEHKPLWMPESPMENTEVSFDWRYAPEAAPEGMTLLLYGSPGDEAPWLYNLSPEGGNIAIEEGSYLAVSYNNDTSGILFRSQESYAGFEAYTRQGNLFDGLGHAYAGSLPQRDTGETVVITPDMMWIGREEAPVLMPEQHLTLYPCQATARYRFTIDKVENLAGAVRMCGSMSGLSGGIMMSTGERTPTPVTLPSAASKSGSESIAGEFLTFGIPADPVAQNILSVYIWLGDGNKYSFNFDVTDQVRNAADPLDVMIEASGIKLPEVSRPPDESGGIGVDVDAWHVVDIELKPIE